MNLTKKQLNNLISLYITEEFKSQAQRKYFYSQANKPGKEGEKWDKLATEFEKSTPKNKKLPKKITEAETKMDYKAVSNSLDYKLKVKIKRLNQIKECYEDVIMFFYINDIAFRLKNNILSLVDKDISVYFKDIKNTCDKNKCSCELSSDKKSIILQPF